MKAKKAPAVPMLDEWVGHLAAGHAEYRGMVSHFALLAKEGMEASQDHGHPELDPDYAYMGREAEGRASPILGHVLEGSLVDHTPCAVQRYVVGKLVNDVIMSGVQTLVLESDRESIVDVKKSLTRGLRGVEGSTVMPEESPVGASAANAVIERSVWEVQINTRAIDAYAEWVHDTVFPGSAILTWAVGFSGQVVSRLQRSVSGGGEQLMNAGSRKTTAKRLFRSVNW